MQIDLQDGEIIWKEKIFAGTSVSPAAYKGMIYIGGIGGVVTSVHVSCDEIKWFYDTKSIIRASPQVNKKCDEIYIANYSGNVFSFNMEGELRWRFKSVGQIQFSPVATGADEVVFTDGKGGLVCLSKEGALLWRKQYPENNRCIPIVAKEGYVYCTFGKLSVQNKSISLDSQLVKISMNTEQIIWSYNRRRVALTSPVFYSGNKIYVNGVFKDKSSIMIGINPQSGKETEYLMMDAEAHGHPVLLSNDTAINRTADGIVCVSM